MTDDLAAGTPQFTFIPTGTKRRFTDVKIGQPFYAHGRIWVRNDERRATPLFETTWIAGPICDFTIDPEDEFVEEIRLQNQSRQYAT